jgi:quercetin dioxygenase-like cupin family protein
MTTFRFGLLAMLLLGSMSVSLSAQAIGGAEKGRPTPDKEPGITTMTVMDRPEFRVLRDWAEAGATRIMHSHPNVTYHVFTLLTGQLTLTIEGKPPLEVKAGDAIDLPAGARHTFTNNGSVTATIVEVFGKAPPKPAQ